MKTIKNTRPSDDFAGDVVRHGTKLVPNKKSGKERHLLYQSLDSDDEDDLDDYYTEERESILDYLDDEDDDDIE